MKYRDPSPIFDPKINPYADPGDGGPALPSETPLGGMTLRDYFAAHAPVDPWPHFMPVMPPKPTMPPLDPVGNGGEAPTGDQARGLNAWRYDACWDPEETDEYCVFSGWCSGWRRFWSDSEEWERRQWVERAEQWPWFYADAMLKRRAA